VRFACAHERRQHRRCSHRPPAASSTARAPRSARLTGGLPRQPRARHARHRVCLPRRCRQGAHGPSSRTRQATSLSVGAGCAALRVPVHAGPPAHPAGSHKRFLFRRAHAVDVLQDSTVRRAYVAAGAVIVSCGLVCGDSSDAGGGASACAWLTDPDASTEQAAAAPTVAFGIGRLISVGMYRISCAAVVPAARVLG
jgi:hypothetical protein